MPLEENEFSSIISRDIACQLTGDASKYQNNPTLEVAWACNVSFFIFSRNVGRNSKSYHHYSL